MNGWMDESSVHQTRRATRLLEKKFPGLLTHEHTQQIRQLIAEKETQHSMHTRFVRDVAVLHATSNNNATCLALKTPSLPLEYVLVCALLFTVV